MGNCDEFGAKPKRNFLSFSILKKMDFE